MSLQYLHYDVFSAEPFRGNQLAVFPDGRGLATVQMQAIAREINFSETTFVLPAERADTDVRMRIFTPFVELPMAGHPTVGSAFALAQEGVIRPSASRFVFGLNIGPTPVDLVWDGERLNFAWMTQSPPTFGPVIEDRQRIAAAIGLDARDLVADLPVQQVSCGVPYLLVPLRDREAVDRSTADAAALAALSSLPSAHPAIFLFSCDRSRIAPPRAALRRTGPSPPVQRRAGTSDGAGAAAVPAVYSRMFAPDLGVLEDPATGSASGPLGCYLVQHGLVAGDAARSLVSNQGVKIGRDSWIHISIAGAPGAITEVKVGGEAVLVARGEFLAAGTR